MLIVLATFVVVTEHLISCPNILSHQGSRELGLNRWRTGACVPHLKLVDCLFITWVFVRVQPAMAKWEYIGVG